MIVERTVTLPVETSRWPDHTWIEQNSDREYERLVRVMMRQVTSVDADGGLRSRTEVWLMPNRFTAAKDPLRIGTESVTYAPGLVDAAAQRSMEFLMETIYGH